MKHPYYQPDFWAATCLCCFYLSFTTTVEMQDFNWKLELFLMWPWGTVFKEKITHEILQDSWQISDFRPLLRGVATLKTWYMHPEGHNYIGFQLLTKSFQKCTCPSIAQHHVSAKRPGFPRLNYFYSVSQKIYNSRKPKYLELLFFFFF